MVEIHKNENTLQELLTAMLGRNAT